MQPIYQNITIKRKIKKSQQKRQKNQGLQLWIELNKTWFLITIKSVFTPYRDCNITHFVSVVNSFSEFFEKIFKKL